MPPLDEDKIIKSWVGLSNVYIGRGTYWHTTTEFLTYIEEEEIHVGRYCSIAPKVVIATGGEHYLDKVSTYPFDNLLLHASNPTRSYRRKPNTRIGSDVWVGQGAHILGGCTVGHGAVIGAKSVVSRDIPPFSIVVGNPSTIIRRRFKEKICNDLLEISWWNWPADKIRRYQEDFNLDPEEFILKHKA